MGRWLVAQKLRGGLVVREVRLIGANFDLFLDERGKDTAWTNSIARDATFSIL